MKEDRRPALRISSDDPEDLVRIWRPQAKLRAMKAGTPDPVGRFLESKGIPRAIASEAAIGIWNEAQRERVRADRPRKVIGGGFMLLGFALETYMIVWNGRFSLIVLLPVLLGASVLWGGQLSRGS